MLERLKGNRIAILWNILRVVIGWQWLVSGYHKIGSFDATGFIKNSINLVSAPNAAVLGWYAKFLEYFVLEYISIFNFLVSWGEFLIGLGLILGLFTKASLLAAAFMNLNFMLAGATYINPILYTVEIILLMMGSAAYRYGIDYFMIPKLKDISFKKNL